MATCIKQIKQTRQTDKHICSAFSLGDEALKNAAQNPSRQMVLFCAHNYYVNN